ncbi:MAG: glycoside hydrolase family 15 protein [Gemmatimonadaceae bacterium]|nr:glycoside hydrolase family 15 protein [Gemmatimonadaceae bacterium]
MPRDLPLANGSLLVCFGRDYVIRDIYFPNIGKDNHATGHPFHFGVWTEGQMAWMGPDWQPDMRYAADTMVTDVRARHGGLGISLVCRDAVDFFENVLVRHIVVRNEAARPRDIRVFFHHDFHISGTDVGDTAFYDPDTQAIIHYKDDRYFLMNCASGGVVGVPQYACGNKEVDGKEGTWRDAEDGELQGNPIAQGSVDSTIGITLHVPAQGAAELSYWMAAGTKYQVVAIIDRVMRAKTAERLLDRTHNYWALWGGRGPGADSDLSARALERYAQSLLIMRSQIDGNGAVLAANDTDMTLEARDTYSYVWPRDGSLVSVALIRAGYARPAERFFEFCSRVISPKGFLRHKFNPDGTLASTWQPYVRDGQAVLPIQEDETALVVWALWENFVKFHDVESTAPFYRSLVTRPADFMLGFVDPQTGLPKPSFDLWEERWGVHAFTVAAVIAGLRAAAELSDAFGEGERSARYRAGADRMLEGFRSVMWNDREQRFARMASPTPSGYTLDMTMDSSLFGLVELDILPPDDAQLESTVRQIAERLRVHTDIGGMARYENDRYHQVETQQLDVAEGNPWFISTLWLARYHIKRATPDDRAIGRALIEWAAERALPSGVMAEQLNPYTGEPLSVSPLTWSHAAYVLAVHDYLDRASPPAI